MKIAVTLLAAALLGASAPTPPPFSPSDGKGSATVAPSGGFPSGTRGTWTITYTAADKGIARGGGIVLVISPFWKWTPPQVASPDYPGYVTARVEKGDAELSLSEGGLNAIVARVVKGRLEKGDRVVFTYGDTLGGKNPSAAARIDRYAERDAAFHVKVDGDGDSYFKEIAHSPTITVTAGPPVKLSVVARSQLARGEKGDIAIAAVDMDNNWDRAYRGVITLSSVPGGLDLPKSCAVSEGGSARIRFTADKPGLYRVEAADEKSGLRARSNPVEVLPRPPGRRLYWADPHGHSAYSDGTGRPDDYYLYGRDVSLLDVIALTDHDAWGIRPLDENPAMWKEIQRVANAFYKPGSLVTYIGYEWTNWTYGHMHVLFRGDRGRLLSTRSKNTDTPPKLWAALPEGKAVTIPHHPGGGPVPTDWNFYNPAFEPVVEICSVHGISERYGGPLAIYHPVAGSFVQDALARGYRLGFVGGGDGHIGHPGIPYADAPTFGLTGIYAAELTREGIWEALFARRTFATTGARIILRFDINGAVMGSAIKAAAPLRITAEAVPTAPIESFELVRNNRVIHRVAENRMEYTFTGKASAGDYFYVRLRQKDDQMAFSSPIWINE